MSLRRLSLLTLLAMLSALGGVAQARPAILEDSGPALVYVSVAVPDDLARFERTGLPAYAHLVGRMWLRGHPIDWPYLLTVADAGGIRTLAQAGLRFRILDSLLLTTGPGSPPIEERYYLACDPQWTSRGSGENPRTDWASYGRLLLDDGGQVLLRASPDDAQRLAGAGVEITVLDPRPITLHPRVQGPLPEVVQPNPTVARMILQVDPAVLYQYEEWLTGEEEADIGSEPYTIVTRHTYSGEPIQKATQFAYEHFKSLGLEVEYDYWNQKTNPNVIATKSGLSNPDEIYILCAHLDDMPSGPAAPGADDNASGSTGVLVAADILCPYLFDCTLIFALWTGEEQGLLGSQDWAGWAADQGLNIQGVLNMDMIAYDAVGPPIVDLYAKSTAGQSVAIANLLVDVVDAYSITLEPEVKIDESLGNYSDNRSFWDEGYSAILAIEDWDDHTPNYHTVNDRLATLNMAYFTEYVKASLGTLVHMSGCLITKGLGHLDGHVSTTVGQAIIAGAKITALDGAGHSFPAIADGTGYYTRTLLAGTYTVTASAPGFHPAVVSDVDIVTDTVTTVDIMLSRFIEVAPERITATLLVGQRITRAVTISNGGAASLLFTLTETLPAAWLGETPQTGTLAPLESQVISVSLDATDLETRVYSCTLEVHTDDSCNPMIPVAIELTVQPLRRVYLPLVLNAAEP